MPDYIVEPVKYIHIQGKKIASFIKEDHNIDWETVDSFGEEWSKFNNFSNEDITSIGNDYFDIIHEEIVNQSSTVLDVGCGTGRWTKYLSSKVKFIEAIDPSKAVEAAAVLLSKENNVRISQASADNIPFPDNSFDFVFSLGVLHHIPDTFAALQKCVNKVKPGGHFLVYLYYNLDNRGVFYKAIFRLSNGFRYIISKLPQAMKSIICDGIAWIIYVPLALLAKVVSHIPFFKKFTESIPLAYYRNTSLQIMRNDALDRFGTPLEQRFSRDEIASMLEKSGLENIHFSEKAPYWHAIGQKAT